MFWIYLQVCKPGQVKVNSFEMWETEFITWLTHSSGVSDDVEKRKLTRSYQQAEGTMNMTGRLAAQPPRQRQSECARVQEDTCVQGCGAT